MIDEQMSWEEAVQWLKEQPEMATLVKNAFYDDPLLDSAKRYHRSSEWSAVQKLLPRKVSGAKVLDIGAGRGISSFSFAADGWDVTALEPDLSEYVGTGAIRNLAIEGGVEIDIVETWGEKLPFPENNFDVAYCRAVLHHAYDLEELCKEVFRVLKPNGVFLATREHVISKQEDLEQFLEEHPLHHRYGGERAYLLSEYLSAMRGAGFKIEKTLNPAASSINMFPETFEEAKSRVSKKFFIPKFLISNKLLEVKAALSNYPGRLYSFSARKQT